MIKEFCAENYTDLNKAIVQGIDRIELCDNLAEGGTTPSYGVIEQSVRLAKQHNVGIVTIIRPRRGDFNYTDIEREIMIKDIDIAFDLGVDGVVLGGLTKDHHLDLPLMRALVEQVNNRGEIVFHMAFDHIAPDKKYETIDQLIALGITRVLLHGQNKAQSVIDNHQEINDYIRYANGRLDFIVGGGVTADNLEAVKKVVETNQFHGTKIVTL